MSTFDFTTAIGRVRATIGDSDTDRQVFTDANITDALSNNGSDETLTAIQLIEVILADLAKQVDGSAVGISHKDSQAYDHYLKLRDQLKKSGTSISANGAIFAFGRSKAERTADRANSDFIQTTFAKDLDDY